LRRYNHIGIPTDVPRAGEVYLERYGLHCTDHESNQFGIQWMRYDAGCSLPDLVKSTPHVAFEVDDLAAELVGREVIIEPNSPSDGVMVAFVLEDGAPVELLQFDESFRAIVRPQAPAADAEPGRIRGFEPLTGSEPRVLILGTAPSVLSLEKGQYYAHPRNGFWRIMEALFSGGRPLEYAERVEMLEQAGVALWDVLRQADRVGSLDANIRRPVANDIAGLLRRHPSIRAAFFNGATAERLFATHVFSTLPDNAPRVARLPSTSPANATISFALKLAAWDAVRVAAAE